MTRAILAVGSISLVAGHGMMTLPPTRSGGSLSLGGTCRNGACLWFSNNVEVTEETLPVEARSVTNGGSPDVYGKSPWRAPGRAPVYGSGCGAAGGGPLTYANGGHAPKGIAQGFDGKYMASMEPSVWQLGSTVDVAWAIAANHGGGYQYRLCKKSENISEECFQRSPLRFAGNTSFIIKPDRSTVEFSMTKVSQGTWPAGSEWARNPIPGCRTCENALEKCGAPLAPIPLNETGGGQRDPWETQVRCYAACSGAFGPRQTGTGSYGACPVGTAFYPAVSGYPGSWGAIAKWSIMDKVVIPSDFDEGEYLLSWRWDCEESTQVWQNCADVRLTKDAPPPTPAPSDSPPPAPEHDAAPCHTDNDIVV